MVYYQFVFLFALKELMNKFILDFEMNMKKKCLK